MHYRDLDTVWDDLLAPGAPFELTEIVVRGQAMRVFKNAPATARDFWLSTEQFADRPYLVYQDDRLSYAQAHQHAAAIANWLIERGLKRGDHVGIAMRNYPEWLLIYWACLCIGATVVGYNAWWVAEEFRLATTDCPPKVIFCDGERWERVAPDSPIPLVAVRCAAPGAIAWSDVLAVGGAMPEAFVDGDDDACIFFTSGTTGRAKGARLTHRGCIINLYSILFAARAQNLAIARATRTTPAPPTVPAALVATPFFHVSACNSSAYMTTHNGGKLVLMHHWDATEALRLVEAEKITSVRGVPTMTRELILHPRLGEFDTTSLLSVGGGGAPMSPDLIANIAANTAHARPSTAYGLTETHGVVSAAESAFLLDKPNSVGRVTPTYDAMLVDDAGQAAPAGALGELCVKGPGVIKGYLNDPKATAEAIPGGWFHTGDIARIDEHGFVFIVDRKKDMLLRGGENIYCAEIEGCLYQSPTIAECCVFGVPDERLGEEVGVAIVLRAPASAAEIRAHCGQRLAKHKVPRFIWILNEGLPRNAAGKFMRRQLRETLRVLESA